MPPRPHKVCRKPGCHKLGNHRNGYCPDCQEFAEKYEAEKLTQSQKAYDKSRGTSTQRGYGDKWRKARIGYLRKHPLCVTCGYAGLTTIATVVDHIVPHRGDHSIFWDSDGWQGLCAKCHNKKTRAGE